MALRCEAACLWLSRKYLISWVIPQFQQCISYHPLAKVQGSCWELLSDAAFIMMKILAFLWIFCFKIYNISTLRSIRTQAVSVTLTTMDVRPRIASNQRCVIYSRDELLTIGQSVGKLTSVNGSEYNSMCLQSNVLHRLRDLKISVTKPTKRGVRAGRKKQRQITVIRCVFAPSTVNYQEGSICHDNLVKVHPNPATTFLKVGMWNSQSARNKSLVIQDVIRDR